MKRILDLRKRHYRPIVSIFLILLIMATLVAGMAGCGGGPIKIYTWVQLDKIRNDLSADYILMNDLNGTTEGYAWLAAATANGGKGWDPIGGSDDPFTGTFDGNNKQIRGLFINRPTRQNVGLFGFINVYWGEECSVIENLGLVNATVTGLGSVGGLVGCNGCTVNNCTVTGNVTGDWAVGGLIGLNDYGPVSHCYFTGNANGRQGVGGLVGLNRNSGTVSHCHTGGTVAGNESVGGLVGSSDSGCVVSSSYSIGSVSGESAIGGLVGYNSGEVSGSHCGGVVTGASQVGGLVGLDTSGSVTGSYSTGDVTGDYFVGGLVGLDDSGSVSGSYSAGEVTGSSDKVGGLAGAGYYMTVSNSYSTGNVAGDYDVGGLVGRNYGSTVSECYSTGSVTGSSTVGGLVGYSYEGEGSVTSSFWDTETSGQNTSAGGTGNTTVEMQDIDTFTGATWDIVAVGGSDERNTDYIWNIVDDVTYPFLSWQPVV
jgi:hypothetical protein